MKDIYQQAIQQIYPRRLSTILLAKATLSSVDKLQCFLLGVGQLSWLYPFANSNLFLPFSASTSAHFSLSFSPCCLIMNTKVPTMQGTKTLR